MKQKANLQLSSLQPWYVEVQNKDSLTRMRFVALGSTPEKAQKHIFSTCPNPSHYDVIGIMKIDSPRFVALAPFVSESYQNIKFD